ncbi:LodA/GoxA family CTQ-dependent oxidase [Pseudoalteromonas luteoviolacea]|uniref:L-Lysine epsilon oxidase N-terminal domain-containing protein n=1 Tax=Pseudoalteromonas luteoviolacea S4060-1 TaxID=1365257 RepID=A0A167P003_9GAMM|nr:LodA/GoxA family CTQ-dependent oxidase [Pseudoalteromonas luteoviolacea]KZN69212.1 hypothetical protein N478_11305 [Pseudoalteromonas luteoviolacea S4060-1]
MCKPLRELWHVANKKAVWYEFNELQGNSLFGDDNSYANLGVPWRNSKAPNRRELIIDPGPPRFQVRMPVQFLIKTVHLIGYNTTFPESIISGKEVTHLGEIITDDKGRLIVLGATITYSALNELWQQRLILGIKMRLKR